MGKLIGALIAIVVLLGAAAAGGWFWLDSAFTGEGPKTEDGKPRFVTVEKGASTQAIASLLKESGAISDDGMFRMALRVRELVSPVLGGEKPVMKAGEYELPSGASMQDIVKELSAGSPLQYAVIVPEGLSVVQIMDILKGGEWKSTRDPARTYKLAGEAPADLAEGTLLPGDYAVSRGDTIGEVVARMQAAQKALLDETWDKRAAGLPVKTREEAIILASVVEKETGNMDEQPMVAGVFVNRLKLPMRLQADSTTLYGITKGRPLGRSFTTKDLTTVTPWNTYQIDGLPQTAIANPGAAAIRATLNPAATDALFFMADGKGGHIFSATYAEHQKHVDAYWKLRKANEAAGVNTPSVRPN